MYGVAGWALVVVIGLGVTFGLGAVVAGLTLLLGRGREHVSFRIDVGRDDEPAPPTG